MWDFVIDPLLRIFGSLFFLRRALRDREALSRTREEALVESNRRAAGVSRR